MFALHELTALNRREQSGIRYKHENGTQFISKCSHSMRVIFYLLVRPRQHPVRGRRQRHTLRYSAGATKSWIFKITTTKRSQTPTTVDWISQRKRGKFNDPKWNEWSWAKLTLWGTTKDWNELNSIIWEFLVRLIELHASGYVRHSTRQRRRRRLRRQNALPLKIAKEMPVTKRAFLQHENLWHPIHIPKYL